MQDFQRTITTSTQPHSHLPYLDHPPLFKSPVHIQNPGKKAQDTTSPPAPHVVLIPPPPPPPPSASHQPTPHKSDPLPLHPPLTTTSKGVEANGSNEPKQEQQQQQQPDQTVAVPAKQPKLHHLTRHWLAPEDRGGSAQDALGASTAKAAEHLIKHVFFVFCICLVYTLTHSLTQPIYHILPNTNRGMSQRELRAAFEKVYGTQTNSYNNNWLRRKLYEAVGVSGGAAARKTKRNGGRDAASRRKEARRAAAAVAEAEAIEALAEIAAGPSYGDGEGGGEEEATDVGGNDKDQKESGSGNDKEGAMQAEEGEGDEEDRRLPSNNKDIDKKEKDGAPYEKMTTAAVAATSTENENNYLDTGDDDDEAAVESDKPIVVRQ